MQRLRRSSDELRRFCLWRTRAARTGRWHRHRRRQEVTDDKSCACSWRRGMEDMAGRTRE